MRKYILAAAAAGAIGTALAPLPAQAVTYQYHTDTWQCQGYADEHADYNDISVAQNVEFDRVALGAQGRNGMARVRLSNTDFGLFSSWNFQGVCGNTHSGGLDVGDPDGGNNVATVVKCDGTRTDRGFVGTNQASQQAIDSEMNGENHPGSVQWVGVSFAGGKYQTGRFFLGLC